MIILNKIKYILFKIPYCFYLKKKNKVIIKHPVCFNKSTRFEGGNLVHSKTVITNSNIGYGTYIGQDCFLANSSIGRYCSIGKDVKVVSATHPTSGFVSTHPAFFSLSKQSGFTYTTKQLFKEHLMCDETHYVVIGNDVWIGTHTIILGGINIGDGAIVAMGSIVTKNVEPYSIVGGTPAKFIRYRFEKEQIAFLCKNKWWLKDPEWLANNSDKFSDINSFIEHFKL